jgi:hypothetical protein
LIFQALGVGFLIVTFCLVSYRTKQLNFNYWIVSAGWGMHFPTKFMKSGSELYILHFTLNRISLSGTLGWKVTLNNKSSWGTKYPFYGDIVKYLPQNVVSH